MAASLEEVARLAALLNDQPDKVAAVRDKFPNEWATVVRLLNAPFFRWAPFGLVDGRSFGGYRGSIPCQAGFLLSRHRNKWALAGNRGGKTIVGLMEDVGDALGVNVVTKERSRRPGMKPPTHQWIVSDTEETSINIVQTTLVEQVMGEDQSGLLWDYVDQECKWSRITGWSNAILRFTNGSTITFKFSTQKRKTFQGARLHKVHFDEVQPQDIYSECIARLADLNGYFVGTMTPIYDDTAGRGIPWIYEELYLQRQSKDVEFHQWSMLDNPHLPQEAKDRLLSHWNADEIEARVHGAFTPIGVRLAFPQSLVRAARPLCWSPTVGQLYLEENGEVKFDYERQHENVLDGVWQGLPKDEVQRPAGANG